MLHLMPNLLHRPTTFISSSTSEKTTYYVKEKANIEAILIAYLIVYI